MSCIAVQRRGGAADVRTRSVPDHFRVARAAPRTAWLCRTSEHLLIIAGGLSVFSSPSSLAPRPSALHACDLVGVGRYLCMRRKNFAHALRY